MHGPVVAATSGHGWWWDGSPNPWALPWLEARGWAGWVAANLLVLLAYAGLGAIVGRFFAAYGLFPSPIWLPAGVACIASMVGGLRLLPGVFAGSFIVNAWLFGSAPDIAVFISLGNAIGPWVGAMATRLFRPPSGLFTRFHGVVGFILGGVLLHAAITAACGTAALASQRPMGWEEAYAVFAGWWLSDSGGTFVFAPALLLWLGAERTIPAPDHRPDATDLAILLATAAAAVVLFAVPGVGRLVRPDAVFLLTVPLSWITLRISLRAAYTLLTVICIVATCGTVMGEGPFQPGVGVANPLQSVGLMTVLFAMDALTLIALTSERREAESRLQETRGAVTRLEARQEALRQEALTDPLTGIGNRRHFLRLALEGLGRARAAGQPVALILFDLDHFKRLNDREGHEAGDRALRAVTESFVEQLPEGAVFSRLGGEEFGVFLADAGMLRALALAERLRATIRQLKPPGLPEGLTASFGVTEGRPGDAAVEDLLRRADRAVYEAKARGRDRVEEG